MPIYQAQCSECDTQFEYQAVIAKCLDVPECPLCGKPARKVILSAPTGFVTGKFEPFKSMVDGSVITCQKDLNEHNKRNGVVNIQEGYSEEKVLRGEFGPKEKPKPDKKEIAKDIIEAARQVEHGYKPKLEVQEDD